MTYKEDMKFQNNCLYETVKVAVSARVMSSDVRWRRKTKQYIKKTWNFKNICLYETGKVAVSARVINSGVRWLRVFHESIHVLRKKNLEIKFRGNFSQQFLLYRIQRTLLEDVLNCFQLAPFAIMVLLLDASHLEIFSQIAIILVVLAQPKCLHFFLSPK